MRAIRARVPDAGFSGFGGKALREAGCTILAPVADNPVMGVLPVLKRIGSFATLLSRAATLFERQRPDALILVDYPGFNMNLAALAHARGIETVYYICPQLWAWAPWRTRWFARIVDHALTILPFEEAYFARFGITARYVGHPVLDRLAQVAPPPAPDAERRDLVLLLPGSRSQEIEHNLPLMLRVAERLDATVPGLRFESAHLTERGRERVKQTAQRESTLALRVHEDLYGALARARLALVTSGTATVEVALMRTPLMVFYKISAPALALSRLLITVPFIAQVNLIRGHRAFPEYLVAHPDVAAIAAEAADLLRDGPVRQRTLSELDALAARLGARGASERAGSSVLGFLAGSNKPDGVA
jgi:lipid-A-disaccharide synthase